MEVAARILKNTPLTMQKTERHKATLMSTSFIAFGYSVSSSSSSSSSVFFSASWTLLVWSGAITSAS